MHALAWGNPQAGLLHVTPAGMHFPAATEPYSPSEFSTPVITTDKLVYEDESQSEGRGALWGFKTLPPGQDGAPGCFLPQVQAVF